MNCCGDNSVKSKNNDSFGIKGNWAFLDGLILAKEGQQARQEICSKCENLKLGFCSACGCIVQFKISFVASECPLKKWGIPEEYKKMENPDVRKD